MGLLAIMYRDIPKMEIYYPVSSINARIMWLSCSHAVQPIKIHYFIRTTTFLMRISAISATVKKGIIANFCAGGTA